jgi:hypothetical protein
VLHSGTHHARLKDLVTLQSSVSEPTISPESLHPTSHRQVRIIVSNQQIDSENSPFQAIFFMYNNLSPKLSPNIKPNFCWAGFFCTTSLLLDMEWRRIPSYILYSYNIILLKLENMENQKTQLSQNEIEMHNLPKQTTISI